ncbi:hypothetical protein T484DRAFT_1765278 [Baffinella frigidus]|nr:hypothetical protein T484DRAFT_1765278 [Cryptophyta sp. CCMP2293]
MAARQQVLSRTMGLILAPCLLAFVGSSGPAGVSIRPIFGVSAPAGLRQRSSLQLRGGGDFGGEDAAAGGEAAGGEAAGGEASAGGGQGEIGEELAAQLKELVGADQLEEMLGTGESQGEGVGRDLDGVASMRLDLLKHLDDRSPAARAAASDKQEVVGLPDMTNTRVVVLFVDGTNVAGTLLGHDKNANLLLDDCSERDQPHADAGRLVESLVWSMVRALA